MRVEVSGLDEIRQALGNGGKVIADKCKAVLALKAAEAVSLARPNVPVDPEGGGYLRDSLRVGRPTYLKGRGTVSVAVILGGQPLESVTRVGNRGTHGGGYNIYAVLQEYDVGEHAPYHHAQGEAHAVENVVNRIAPTIPDDIVAAIRPADLGGA